MKIITKLVILTLSLLLVNADQYCDNLIKQYNKIRMRCSLPTVAITNCCDLTRFSTPSGIFKIKKTAFSCIDVYCNMTISEGGWIVIQRNRHGSLVSFNRKWIDYKEGFGDLNSEFWFGLENIRYLTKTGQWKMRLDYQKNDTTWSYLHYNRFSVGSSIEEYPLTVRGFGGEGTDHFSSHPLHRAKFSTPDNDNDQSNDNCAALYKSGWWYNDCRNIDINQQPPHVKNTHVLSTEMKIRPRDCMTGY